MNKISIRSTAVLLILGLISIACLVIVEMTKQDVEQDWYNEKMKAAQIAQKSMTHLKNKIYGEGTEILDNINDPNETGLIGEEFTSITTDNGSLPIKLSTLNPNFAALVVQLLKDAGVEKGDNIAVCMTGSFPGLNISALAAMQTLELNPIVICSATSSSWGATNPEYTWLDMLTELNKANLISIKSVAASIGGNQDIGMALSTEGREKIANAIKRNHSDFINGDDLKANIEARLNIFNVQSKNKPIKLFVNIGGGVASLGSNLNGNAIPAGLNEKMKLVDIPDKRGVAFEMAKTKTPIVHLLNIEQLLKKYDLPLNPIPMQALGTGRLFFDKKYNMTVLLLVTSLLLILIIGVAYQDRKQNELGTKIIKDEKIY